MAFSSNASPSNLIAPVVQKLSLIQISFSSVFSKFNWMILATHTLFILGKSNLNPEVMAVTCLHLLRFPLFFGKPNNVCVCILF